MHYCLRGKVNPVDFFTHPAQDQKTVDGGWLFHIGLVCSFISLISTEGFNSALTMLVSQMCGNK